MEIWREEIRDRVRGWCEMVFYTIGIKKVVGMTFVVNL